MKKLALATISDTEVGKNVTTKIGKNWRVEVGDSIEFVCGKSVLRMDKDGHISVNGHEIVLGATGEQHYQADGNITVKAKNILEN